MNDMKIENLDCKMEAVTFEFEDQPKGDGSTLHERRIEVIDVNENGIFFVCHDDDNNPCHVLFSAADARHLAAELLEGAADLDRIVAPDNDCDTCRQGPASVCNSECRDE